MSSSCREISDALAKCLGASRCVQDGGDPRACLRDKTSDVPEPCRALAKMLYDCNRAKIDRRFRMSGSPGAAFRETIEDDSPANKDK
jgi:hypothetical protein